MHTGPKVKTRNLVAVIVESPFGGTGVGGRRWGRFSETFIFTVVLFVLPDGVTFCLPPSPPTVVLV